MALSYSTGVMQRERKRLSVVGLLVGILMLAVSCTTTPAGRDASPAASSGSPSTTSSSFSSDLKALQELSADLRPQAGVPRFVGVADRRLDRSEEEAEAVRHVAEQASRYVRIAARYRYVSQRDSTGIGYVDEIDTGWDESLADSLEDDVDIQRTVQLHDGTIVIATVAGLPGSGEAPPLPAAWTSRPPEVPGYFTAVGTAQRRRRLRSSVDAADQEALTAVLLQAGSTVRLIEDRRSVERRGTTGMVTSAEEAEATLAEFHVIARAVSDDGQYLYSLAVAREVDP